MHVVLWHVTPINFFLTTWIYLLLTLISTYCIVIVYIQSLLEAGMKDMQQWGEIEHG